MEEYLKPKWCMDESRVQTFTRFIVAQTWEFELLFILLILYFMFGSKDCMEVMNISKTPKLES